ncbi:MAG: hypothetical protein R3F43_24675 [bacterium]
MRALLTVLAIIALAPGCSKSDGPGEVVEAVDLDVVIDAFQAALSAPDPVAAAAATAAPESARPRERGGRARQRRPRRRRPRQRRARRRRAVADNQNGQAPPPPPAGRPPPRCG